MMLSIRFLNFESISEIKTTENYSSVGDSFTQWINSSNISAARIKCKLLRSEKYIDTANFRDFGLNPKL